MVQRVSAVMLVILFLVIAVGVGYFYREHIPRHDLAYYYSMIRAQESAGDVVDISDADWARLKDCKAHTGRLAAKRVQDCLTDFYVSYTLQNGVKRAFSHLALLEQKDENFIGDCHYISHGIGHAQLQRSGGNAGSAFAILSEDAYFKNVSTCGNGYFHGVVEEYARHTTDRDELVVLLTAACKESTKKFLIDCFHGMGHAAFVQLEYDTEGALYVCDNVSKDPVKKYSCYMGVFMEMAQDFPTRDMVDVRRGLMSFRVCDGLKERYQSACYAQHSAFFENFNSTPKDFKKNIGYCRQVANGENRMACVKFFAGRATRAHFGDIRGMCVDSTSNRDERLMCTGVFATRIASAIDSSRKSDTYGRVVSDVCRALPFYELSACLDLVMHKSETIYFNPAASGAML